MRFPGLLELLRVRHVLTLPDERLLGEILATLLERQHRALLPICSLTILAVGLVAETLLIRDRRRNLLLRLPEPRSHDHQNLIEHLFGTLLPTDQMADCRPHQAG